MITTPIVLQPRWRSIDDDPPKDGRWLWGEWPAIKSALRFSIPAPRIVAPMRWGKSRSTTPHWMREGSITYGDGPVRWAEMIYPVGDEPVSLDQDNALTREGLRHALMHLDLPLIDNGIVDYD